MKSTDVILIIDPITEKPCKSIALKADGPDPYEAASYELDLFIEGGGDPESWARVEYAAGGADELQSARQLAAAARKWSAGYEGSLAAYRALRATVAVDL